MRAWSVPLLLFSLAGCALTSKATPLDVRYFSPAEVAGRHDPPGDAPQLRVRIGRLTSSANLRYRIVHRESPVETGEYEELRWTEYPEAYVRRSLEAALAADRVELATGGAVPALDVEVLGFEEVRRPGYHGGRVELRYQLRNDTAVLATDVVVAERAASGAAIDSVVVAIGAAMDAATASLSRDVAGRIPR